MSHPFHNLQAAEQHQLVHRLLKLLVRHLPREEGEDANYSITEPTTQRSFEVRRSEGFRDADNPAAESTTRYFMSEYVPTGVVCHQVNGKDVYNTDPRIQSLETSAGPNGLHAGLLLLGINPDTVVSAGGGYGVGAKFHDTLEDCAKAVAEALVSNKRYEYFEPLTPQEQVRLDAKQARQSWAYWDLLKRSMEAAMQEPGLFQGCSSMLGPLSADVKEEILSYVNNPTQASWLSIRGFCVIGGGTLWQAWCQFDEAAPNAGKVGFPNAETLRQALRHAVSVRQQEIEQRLQGLSPSGLRKV